MGDCENKMKHANKYLEAVEATSVLDEIDLKPFKLPLKVGVDLGTSNIVVVVLDQDDRPVAYEMEAAEVVKDGIVVQYLQAVKILERMKRRLQERLGVELNVAAAAIPPGIISGNTRVICNVIEGAGFKVVKVIDEPEAASIMMEITNGIVVDIGGGTTGVSVIRKGKVLYSMDEPTGGTHMTLVVAGATGLDFPEAESYKKDPENYHKIFPMIEPVVEKMADIAKRFMKDHDAPVYLAGGTSCLRGIEGVFQKYLGRSVYKPENPLLVTPVGIAMSLTLQDKEK